MGAHLAGGLLSAERLWALRHDRQCLAMDEGLVVGWSGGSSGFGALLRGAESDRRPARRQLRPSARQHPDTTQSAQGRFAPVRAELLPALSSGRALSASGGHVDFACGVPVRGEALSAGEK